MSLIKGVFSDRMTFEMDLEEIKEVDHVEKKGRMKDKSLGKRTIKAKRLKKDLSMIMELNKDQGDEVQRARQAVG